MTSFDSEKKKKTTKIQREDMFNRSWPSLLIVIPNKWVVHISQAPLNNAFHSLEKKWLVLGVDILNTLHQKPEMNSYSILNSM